MDRRTFLSGSAGLAGGLIVAPGQPVSVPPDRWPPGAAEYVQAYQERQYRRLGEQLGWGDNPAATHGRLTRPPMPLEQVATGRAQSQLGAAILTAEQWALFEQVVSKEYARYAAVVPPTPYENPNRYRSMVMTFDQLQPARTRLKAVVRPLLATLPSGEVNARICEEPQSGAPILFFEEGLFEYFYQFARNAALAVPDLTADQLSDDAALAQIEGKHIIPLEASQGLLACLGEYTIKGTLRGLRPAPLPPSKTPTAMALLAHMERFAMAHEMAHVGLGHLAAPYDDKAGAWEQEFAADVRAMEMMTQVPTAFAGSRALAIWACDLALIAMDLLDRALALMQFGERRVSWVSETHPDANSRRRRLRERALSMSQLTDVGRAVASAFWRMNDAIFVERLWAIVGPMLVLGRAGSNDRPSPLWRERISRVFKESV